MKSLHALKTSILLSSAAIMLGVAPVAASTGVYEPRSTTRQWRTHIVDAPVKAIHVTVRRASGGTDVFFNLRFGRAGHTFDGRRVYLKHGGMERASWYLNGRRAGGEELVLNSYNGSVHVEKVEVVYEGNERRGHDRRDRYDSYDDHGGRDYVEPRHQARYQPDHRTRYQARPVHHEYRHDRRGYYDDSRPETYRRDDRYAGRSACGGCSCGRDH